VYTDVEDNALIHQEELEQYDDMVATVIETDDASEYDSSSSSGRRLLRRRKSSPPPPPPPPKKVSPPPPPPNKAPSPHPKAKANAKSKLDVTISIPEAKSTPSIPAAPAPVFVVKSVPAAAPVVAAPVVAAPVVAAPVVAAPVVAAPVVAAPVVAAPVVAAPVVAAPVVAAPVVAAPVVAAPVVAAPAPMSIYMTCDNVFDLYVNGNKVGSGDTWTTTYHFSTVVKPGDVIALDGVDKGGPAAFIGVFGGKVTKPSEWKCSTKNAPGWTTNNFDDSSWSNAVSYGRNQDGNIWRSVGGSSRPNIPGDAEWLWTNNNENHDRVYCRYFPVKPAPAPVPAPVVAAPASVVAAPAAPATVTKQNAIDEIVASKKKTDTKLTKFQEKLVTLMKETSDEQQKVETENRNNYNGVSVTLQNEQLRLESSRLTMKKLYDETEKLNATIQTHYKKLIADTQYLQTLDEMRPAFLKSLGELASHIQAVKSTVDKKIVKDEYKDEMMTLLTGIHFNTHNISGYVATAFVNHYNKYKNLIQKETADYSSEVKKLTILSNEYKVQVQKTADIEKERVRLQDILAKLKETLTLSVTQREEFDLLVKEVVSIFDKKRC
jgi:hypothetical protein